MPDAKAVRILLQYLSPAEVDSLLFDLATNECGENVERVALRLRHELHKQQGTVTING